MVECKIRFLSFPRSLLTYYSMILHPRLCFQILNGHAIGWGCQKDITREQHLDSDHNSGKYCLEDPGHLPV